ncbi:MAG: hypothetical protein HND48_24690 [Chloroflexi bacterium]|nr:hypothetical protein [Chloroflexota bacterium]
MLRELYLAREALAERANIPPMNVVQNRTLVELAREQPARAATRCAVSSAYRTTAFGVGATRCWRPSRAANMPRRRALQPSPKLRRISPTAIPRCTRGARNAPKNAASNRT